MFVFKNSRDLFIRVVTVLSTYGRTTLKHNASNLDCSRLGAIKRSDVVGLTNTTTGQADTSCCHLLDTCPVVHELIYTQTRCQNNCVSSMHSACYRHPWTLSCRVWQHACRNIKAPTAFILKNTSSKIYLHFQPVLGGISVCIQHIFERIGSWYVAYVSFVIDFLKIFYIWYLLLFPDSHSQHQITSHSCCVLLSQFSYRVSGGNTTARDPSPTDPLSTLLNIKALYWCHASPICRPPLANNGVSHQK